MTDRSDPAGPSAAAAPFPPFVYAPVTELPGEPGVERLQMHQLADGRTALFVYSALDRMATLYGDRAFTVLGAASLEAAHAQVPYDVVLLDRQLVRTTPQPQVPAPAATTVPRGVFLASGAPAAAATPVPGGAA